ncbi:MAG: hypothetical protein M1819_000051 [Sarea resinae]|nr:MAG: hypothetical protein M1819_000051 [Sarea resinae]
MAVFSFLFVFVAAIATVCAQTPPGFSPSCSTNLDVEFGTTLVGYPGQLWPQNAVASSPRLGTAQPLAGPHVAVMVDPDITLQGQKIEALHWIASNLASANGTAEKGTFSQLAGGTTVSPYLSPVPMAAYPPHPHRYTVVLFAQPANFSVPPQYASFVPTNASAPTNKFPFDITAFASAAGLGAPVAANYFDVQNTSVAAASTGAVGTGTAASTGVGSTTASSSGWIGTGTPKPTSSPIGPFTGDAGETMRAWTVSGLLTFMMAAVALV